jgi:peptide deformylase
MKLPNMKSLNIVCYPDPVLKKKCDPVETFDPGLRDLADRMVELMRQAQGVGLAAPQVGLPIRLFVYSLSEESGSEQVCVNPTLSGLDGAEEKEEGCLSIPDALVTMRRATKVVMDAFDITGKPFQCVGSDLEARIWQHETDHLNGRLIIDNMSATDEIGNRRAMKQLVAEYSGPQH